MQASKPAQQGNVGLLSRLPTLTRSRTGLGRQPVTRITGLFPRVDAIALQDTPEIGTATEVMRAIAPHTISSV